MNRTKKQDRKDGTMTIRLPAELERKFRNHAKRNFRSASDEMRRLITQELTRSQ